MKKIKVAHIITELVIGGAQDNTLLTAENHDRARYDVTLISSPGGGYADRARKGKYRTILISDLVREIAPTKDIRALFKLYRILKKEKFEVVHTHSSKAGMLGRIAAYLAGTRVIVHTIHSFPFHLYMSGILRWFYIICEKLAAKLSSAIVSVSGNLARQAQRLGIVPPEKIAVIYSGIDFNKFSTTRPKRIRQELGLEKDQLLVGSIGRMFPQKAPEIFIRAARELLDRGVKAKFVFVGGGPLLEDMKKLVRDLDLENDLLLPGFRDDAPDILAAIDIFVISSRWEGIGRALTEALFMGKPVVATNVGGVNEVVRNLETGILVPPGDYRELSAGIKKLIDDPKLAEKLGRAGKKLVSDRFDYRIMIRKIEQLYEKLLNDS